MLGKLIKHEWKAVAKILGILHLALLAMSVVGRLLLSIDVLREEGTLWVVLLMVYMLSVFAVSVGSQLFLAVRFYKNMYTDEGYLTFTLPVKPWEHILAKLSAASTWVLIDIVTIFVSILILVLDKEMISEFVPAWNEIVLEIELSNMIGVFDVILIIFALILSLVSAPLLCYFSISIGQLFRSHKLLASVITYFITTNVIQVFSTLISAGYMVVGMNKIIETEGKGLYSDMLLISTIASVVMCVVFWSVVQFIMSKKLNLE